uniref:Uncharacterized protein n=1 Tax=Anguilla anguilla TaxID=7936 RepID=A0A0E9R5F9_ANGAN
MLSIPTGFFPQLKRTCLTPSLVKAEVWEFTVCRSLPLQENSLVSKPGPAKN